MQQAYDFNGEKLAESEIETRTEQDPLWYIFGFRAVDTQISVLTVFNPYSEPTKERFITSIIGGPRHGYTEHVHTVEEALAAHETACTLEAQQPVAC